MKKMLTYLFAALSTIVFSSSTTINSLSPTSSSLCAITKLELIKIPALQSDGSTWDMSSGPDVYFKIKKQDEVIFESSVATDLDVSTLPISFTKKFPFTLPYANNQYTILFYDYEQGSLFKDDTYIDDFTFNPKDFQGQAKIEFSNENSTFQFTLEVEWE